MSFTVKLELKLELPEFWDAFWQMVELEGVVGILEFVASWSEARVAWNPQIAAGVWSEGSWGGLWSLHQPWELVSDAHLLSPQDHPEPVQCALQAGQRSGIQPRISALHRRGLAGAGGRIQRAQSQQLPLHVFKQVYQTLSSNNSHIVRSSSTEEHTYRYRTENTLSVPGGAHSPLEEVSLPDSLRHSNSFKEEGWPWVPREDRGAHNCRSVRLLGCSLGSLLPASRWVGQWEAGLEFRG